MMSDLKLYPVQIQADNKEARESYGAIMIHVFDMRSEAFMLDFLWQKYLHVVSWDAAGNLLTEFDRRQSLEGEDENDGE